MHLVCFDSQATTEEQVEQITRWLDFINSIPPPSSSIPQNNKRMVFLVGLRAEDIPPPGDEPSLQQSHFESWKNNYSLLDLSNQIFMVNCIKSPESIQNLFNNISSEGERIFLSNLPILPLSFKEVLNEITSTGSKLTFIKEDQLMKQSKYNEQPRLFQRALQSLHSCGQIIICNNGLVCINPFNAQKMMAKFVSPQVVRRYLLQREDKKVSIHEWSLLEIDLSSNER